MEEQQRTQQLLPERNGKHPHALLPAYTPLVQEQKTDEWDLRQLLTMVRRRAIVIGSVAIAICGTTWFWTLSRQAVYEGKFGLLVESVTSERQLAGLSQVPGVNANSQQEGLDYDTQILVLKSPELVAPIVKQISTRYPDINYASLIDNLKISRFLETKIIEVSYQDSDPQKIKFVLEQVAKGYVKYSIQQRQNSLNQGIQFVDFQLPQLRGRVNSLQVQLQRFREQYNFIDPEGKVALLEQKVGSLESQRLDTQKQLAETRRFYKALQGKTGAQLAMQAESGSLDMTAPGQSSVDLAQSGALNRTLPSSSGTEQTQSSSLNRTSQDLLNAKQTESGASNQTSTGRSSAAVARSEGSIYQGLVSQLRDLDSQIALESTRFQEDSPHIQALRQKRKNLLPVLQQEAKRTLGNKLAEVANQIAGMETGAAKIAQAEGSLNQQIKQLPNLARRYTDLQRELRIATEGLNRFLEKRESLQVEAAQKEMPWQMIAAPQLPQVPISPNVQRNIVMGMIGGILAGMGAALLIEKLDNVFHSSDEIKEVTKLPLLGIIPFHKHLKQLAPVNEESAQTIPDDRKAASRNNSTQGYSYFPFLEAFRSLHTNIGFLGSDTPIHSIVISSAVHAEGKSTVALNLAQAAAAMGKRVLLVDADLRLPQVHNLLSLSNEQGLSNAISANLPVLEAIQRSPLWDNLFVLTSGQVPPDPTKLLSSKKMQNIMEQLRQEFDMVIYDAPPLLGLADSSLIAAHTSGMVLVTRMGKTDRSLLKQTLDGLKFSRSAVLGIVCNGVKNYNDTPYTYYYYRSRPTTAGAS